MIKKQTNPHFNQNRVSRDSLPTQLSNYGTISCTSSRIRKWICSQQRSLVWDKIKADKFPGELSKEIILFARVKWRIYQIEKQDFKEKMATIREDSNVQYNKIVNQRSLSTDMKDIEDNLAKLAKLVNDLKIKN